MNSIQRPLALFTLTAAALILYPLGAIAQTPALQTPEMQTPDVQTPDVQTPALQAPVEAPKSKASDKTSVQTANLKTLAQAVDARYHVHGKALPLMWLVSGLARTFSGNGVSNMRLVTYEDIAEAGADHPAFAELVRARLNDGWSLMVRDHVNTPAGEDNTIWVQPHGKRVRLLVVNLEGRELNLIQMELSPEALTRWKIQHGS